MEELKEGWRRVKLNEIINFNPKETLKKNTVAKYIEMANLQCFSRNVLGYEEKEYKGGTKFRNGDTLLARITPCLENGKTAYINCLEKNEVAFGSTEYIILREKENISDKKFIYYLAISNDFRELAIKSMTGTSGRQRVQIDMLINSEINLPPLETQEKIASILSALDDKIEINNEMNKTLEEMAQTLFKRWFIDFDFPNENGEPYRSSGGKMVDSELGEIPSGWEVSDIYKISNVIYGAPFKSKQFNEEKKGFPLIRIRDLKTFNPQFFTEENHPKKTLVNPGDLLVGMDAEFRATSWLGKTGVLNQRVCMFFPNKDVVGKYFLKMILEKPLSFFENSKVATTVIHLGKSDIDMIKIICPNDLILEKFKELTEYIYQKKINNAQEIQSLKEIRDTLLPKLMNGEIEI
ncbi:restriction endonuclease subunit S [Cetobacterium sp. SF1]|uniref:restriction endonuclease subunit S n=1 Tax=Cetobacterium sp. SF1 TaxID=3417654 RepID=UPI003CF838A6